MYGRRSRFPEAGTSDIEEGHNRIGHHNQLRHARFSYATTLDPPDIGRNSTLAEECMHVDEAYSLSEEQGKEIAWKEAIDEFIFLSSGQRDELHLLELHKMLFIFLRCEPISRSYLLLKCMQPCHEWEEWKPVALAKAPVHRSRSQGPQGFASFEGRLLVQMLKDKLKKEKRMRMQAENHLAHFMGETTCSICHENYIVPPFEKAPNGAPLHFFQQLPCGHTFCRDCINNWLRNNDSCPICRRNVVEGYLIIPQVKRRFYETCIELNDTKRELEETQSELLNTKQQLTYYKREHDILFRMKESQDFFP